MDAERTEWMPRRQLDGQMGRQGQKGCKHNDLADGWTSGRRRKRCGRGCQADGQTSRWADRGGRDADTASLQSAWECSGV